MNIASQFSLRWNNYVNHVTGAFNLLRLDNDMVDVTLCCDGGKIKAHKVLLSVCSNYFKEIFKDTPCQHPIIIFKNVKFEDLNAIVNFMYHGEVSIFQEQLESFLITAEMLEVKGLTDNSEEMSTNVNVIDSAVDQPMDDSVPVSDDPINLVLDSNTNKDANAVPNNTSDDYNLIIDSSKLNEISTNNDSNIPQDDRDSMNQDRVSDALDHASSDTDVALKFRCTICPKGFKHPTSLTLHKDAHAGKTQCPVCHRSFSRSYDMRSHLQRIHRGKQLIIKEIKFKGGVDKLDKL